MNLSNDSLLACSYSFIIPPVTSSYLLVLLAQFSTPSKAIAPNYKTHRIVADGISVGAESTTGRTVVSSVSK